MKVETCDYYCDICKQKFDGQCEIVIISQSFADHADIYVGGKRTEHKEVCNYCTASIAKFIKTQLEKHN